MHHEPIRHHYIPQFILKNFCFHERQLYYFDKQIRSVSVKDTRDVFMERNLYRDEINYASDPVKIEKDLAEFERAAAQIIREHFLNDREVFITPQEDEMLKLFFAVMGFRSLHTSRCFGEKRSRQTQKFYGRYQANGELLDMWKRNLGHIVQCRSFEDIRNHPHIDEPIKLFFHRDTGGYFGKYITVAEVSDENAFIIGDIYPVVISGVMPNGLPLHMYDLFPISPRRALFLASEGVQYTPKDVLILRDFIFQPPKTIKETGMLRIRVKKLCTDESRYLNRQIAENAQKGFAFINPSEQLAEVNV